MEKYRFLLSGSGGQGVITMAILLAEAAVLYEGLTAVQSQAYGPEARGGATRSDVIVSDGPIYFPKVTQPNILVALNQASFIKYQSAIRPGGIQPPRQCCREAGCPSCPVTNARCSTGGIRSCTGI